jgi:hypothetical protein
MVQFVFILAVVGVCSSVALLVIGTIRLLRWLDVRKWKKVAEQIKEEFNRARAEQLYQDFAEEFKRSHDDKN